jgi:Right handed beta helix region
MFDKESVRQRTSMRAIVGVLLFCVCLPVFAATYYVSPSGSDTAVGTLLQPFRTIDRCAQVTAAGDTCSIRAGTYRETIRPANSGTANSPITFVSYKGEAVTVSGADPVTGWVQHQGNIYRAPVVLPVSGYADEGFLANQVFANGETMIEARWPNTGADLMRPTFAGGGVNSPVGLDAVVSNNGIPNIGESWAGATVWTQEWYVSRTGTITGGSGTSLNATMTAPWERGGFWFYLTNKLGLLDTAREWFYDGSANQLYFWAPSGDVPVNVEAKQRNFAFDLRDRSHIVVSDIGMFAATITTSNASVGVTIDNVDAKYVSHHVTLPILPASEGTGYFGTANSVIASHTHDTGIQLRGTGHTLKNSRIAWSSGNGVMVKGSGHAITNNVIENVNYVVSYASGLRLNGSGHKVTHNTVRRAGRDGLTVDWTTAPFDFANNEIAYNDISLFGMLSTDLGAMYFCCYINLAGTTIHHNRIHDGFGWSPFWGTRGIYLDIESFNATVHHNVVWNLKFAADHAAYLGSTQRGFHRLYNNTFLTEMYIDAGVEAKNNIFRGSDTIPSTIATNNLLRATDPKLVDVANDNLQLQSSSPGIDAGIAISGITGKFTGTAPDIGAYEFGTVPWRAGAVPLAAPNGSCRYDIDRSGKADALIDGTMIVRNALGLSDEALTSNSNPLATSSIFIRDVYERERDALDVDGDGNVSISDVQIVLRWLLGYSGDALLEGLAPNAPRDNTGAVASHLAAMCPR